MIRLRQHTRQLVPRCITANLAMLALASASVAVGAEVGATNAATVAATHPLAGSAEEILNPPTEKLKPRRAATASQRDRATAIRLFTEARLLFHRGQLDTALKKYQRAARIHPNGIAIAREVVPLAADLNRFDMGARYALLAADHPPANPLLIYRLALAKAINNHDDEAKRLYEIAIQHDRSEIPQPIALLASLELGRIYYLQGQYRLATQALEAVDQALQAPADYGLDEELQQMLLGDPESTYALLGDCYLKNHQIDDAAAALDRANQVSDRPMRLFRTAQLLAAQQKQAAAIATLHEYLTTKSTAAGTEPYALLCQMLDDPAGPTQGASRAPSDTAAGPRPPARAPRKHVSATAIAKLEALRQQDSENVALAVFIAEQYLGHDPPDPEQLARAEEILQPFASELAPVEVYQGLLQIHVARANWNKVLAGLEQWIAAIGELAALDDRLLEQLQQQRSRTALRTILEDGEHEATAEARVAVAQLALRAKDYPTAARLLQSAFTEPRKSIAVFLLDGGIELLMANQYELATQLFRQLGASQGIEGQAWITGYYLAGGLEMQERTDEALLAIDAAIARSPRNAVLLGRKAWILDHAGKASRAAELYQQIIAQFADDYASSEIRGTVKDARSALSNLRVKDDKLAEATELLQQVLDEYPSDPGAMNDLGYLWADQNKLLERARRLIEKAVQTDPDNGAYHDSLGWVHYRLGDPATAIQHLEKAVSLEEPDPVILEHLGDVLQALDRPTDALVAWRQAQTLYVQQHNEHGRAGIEKKLTQYAAE